MVRHSYTGIRKQEHRQQNSNQYDFKYVHIVVNYTSFCCKSTAEVKKLFFGTTGFAPANGSVTGRTTRRLLFRLLRPALSHNRQRQNLPVDAEEIPPRSERPYIDWPGCGMAHKRQRQQVSSGCINNC